MSSATSNHRLKVGIDFGTTYSGVAWAHTGNPKEVVIIREWPGGTRTSDKVPSEISYKSNGEVDKWGFEIKPSAPRIVWFKLLLDPTKYAATPSSTIVRTNRLIPGSKKPVDVVKDYLTCLKNHTIKTLERTYGKAFLDVTPIDYCLTVPAIWNDAAKALTLQAAESAGFGTKDAIRLVSEPEAAAAWSLMKDIQPNNLKVDDAFVVVDCGGGTVDLISYKVVGLEPSLEVKECAVGSGALCGSTFLNQRFEDLVKSRIRDKFDRMKEGSRNIMMKHFEEFLKRSFSNSEDDDIFSCPIPGVPDDPIARVEDGCFVLTRGEMKDIFDPVINRIIQLVREQITTAEGQSLSPFSRGSRLSSILLVGGFGASKYLLQRLEADMLTWRRRSSPIQILQPVNAWSAVARGAVLRGLEGGLNISSRKARRHYGTVCYSHFNFGKDPLDKLRYCPYTGDPLCRDTMKYYVKLGDQVSENVPIPIHFHRHVSLDANMIFTEQLFESDEITAPQFTTSSGVKMLCTFTSDLSSVPRSLFTKKEGVGSSYYEISYNLVMTLQSALLVWHIEFQGKKYGSVTAKYTYE